jgi:hypothetical protein
MSYREASKSKCEPSYLDGSPILTNPANEKQGEPHGLLSLGTMIGMSHSDCTTYSQHSLRLRHYRKK